MTRHSATPLRTRVAARLPMVLLGVSLVLCGTALVLMARTTVPSTGEVSLVRQAALPLSLLPFSVVAALVARRRPENSVGWIFAGIGLSGQIQSVATSTIRYFEASGGSLLDLPRGVIWLANTWVLTFALITLLFLVFPDGRLPSKRWRPLAWIIGLHTLLGVLVVGMKLGSISTQLPLIHALLGEDTGSTVTEIGRGVQGLGTLALFAIAVVSLGWRLRRARGVERLQLKWFTYAGVLVVLAFVATAALFFSPLGPRLDPGATVPPALLYGVPVALSFAAVPVAAGFAILRYRLYDIDLFVNRAVVYAALTTCVVALYVLLVGGLSALFQTGGNLLISLAATTVVALLFQPLRERLQRLVNRLTYGDRDDPYAAVSRLARRLESTLAPDAILPTIVHTLREALRVPYTAIALVHPEGLQTTASSGVESPDPLRLPLVYQGALLGELSVARRSPGDEFTTADRRLLEDLARQAGIAAHAVQLTLDLQRSREKLVNAREEERRRLRRDLHDGLGSQLAAVTVQLNVLRGLVRRDPEAAEEGIAEVRAEVRQAIANIRRLVYELRPPALDELGLVGAIRERAAQCSNGELHVRVEAPEKLPPLPAAVEVAAYRVVQEALANVVNHARARNCTVRLAVGEQLDLLVSDDGAGINEEGTKGVGLLSMRERAAELGGTCSVARRPGGGTGVAVRLPLAATVRI